MSSKISKKSRISKHSKIADKKGTEREESGRMRENLGKNRAAESRVSFGNGDVTEKIQKEELEEKIESEGVGSNLLGPEEFRGIKQGGNEAPLRHRSLGSENQINSSWRGKAQIDIPESSRLLSNYIYFFYQNLSPQKKLTLFLS